MLRRFVKPGATVYTILRKVARSGMSRCIDLYTFDDGRKVYLTGYVANVLGYTRTDDGIRVGGCGTDAGFDTVYNLARTLFRDSFVCTGEKCQSNDHSNGDRNFAPHAHSDGGYALRHEWL